MKDPRGMWRTVFPAMLWAFLGIAGNVFAQSEGQGALTVIEPDGKPGQGCPLEHTSVKAEISGFIARVTVKQVFHNPRKDKIEAIYTFPLSADGAVDEMVMRVGDRVVRGTIKRREEARRIYEQARDRGQVASLLDQERPNIFTQSVANIMPGEKVEITIGYSEILPYDDGAFTFAFPMVVGPRFIPGQPTGQQGTGWAKDSAQVPDASRITPPVTPKDIRAGHDIDVSVSIDAGVPILDVSSKLHEVNVEKKGPNLASVAMKNKNEIPNKDFVLRYLVAGDEIKSGVITHKDGKEGYATVVLIPPKRVKPEQVAPKEMIFVIDCSGSQSGWPLDKAKETMKHCIDNMNPEDTFNIIDFNVNSRMLFPESKKNTPENRFKAHKYLASLHAQGGTWMGPAVEQVCKSPAPENRLRIVTFMTDGYVGNDFEILDMILKLRGKSRWFPFGTGNSVNRFLLDNMAKLGGGEVEYVLLNTSGEEAAKRFYERISSPVLTDITLNLKGIELKDIFPRAISDLWARKPLVFRAAYTTPGKGKLTISGFAGGKPYEQTLDVTLPDKEAENPAISKLWARAKVDELMEQDYLNMQRGKPDEKIKEEIVQVALAHSIMTQFTSFVAVEETIVTIEGKPTRVTVPVEMPDGVSREGVFGGDAGQMSPGVPPSAAVPASLESREMKGSPQKTRLAAPPVARPTGAVPSSAPPPPMKYAKPGEVAKRPVGGLNEVARRDVKADKEEEVDRKLKDEAKLTDELRELVKLIQEKKDVSNYSKGKVRVVNGQIILKIQLIRATDELIKKLEELGLKVSWKAAAGQVIIGTLAVEKLEALLLLPEVVAVEPVTPEA